ncbi:replication initiator protein A [Lentilactobacillus hilgardii]|uniref:replication initiator protein A n=1 Tax=Lentilactobacillus hilgardii TaxID=1588 RepID=UPI0021A70434|nr:replication initiator protein A [Lentilactobacillus hilgardii]MCT3392671.1 plasmid replication initiation protein [Lentilactobacillus hilgardii]
MTKSTNFNYYEANNVYGALFFQFPKVLMYGEQYKHLSNDAKLAYMVLKDRLEYSLRNNWVDSEGHVYFIFTNQELMDLFNCSKGKVIKIKTELESIGLLVQKQMGFNPKTKKNEPNRLYLSKLDVKATDVYLRGEYSQNSPQTLATSGSSKNELPRETVETLATSGSSKNGLPHKFVDNSPQTLATSGSSKNGLNLYKEPKEKDKHRYNIDTQKLDFSTANFSSAEIQKQNQDLVNHANDFLTDEDSGLPVFLEPEAVQLLSFWCRTPQQMRRFIGIILNAKYRVEKDHQDIGVLIPLDDEELKPLMTKALRRYFNALRSNEKHIKNVENYLYGTMQNLFGIWWNKQAAREYAAKHPEEEKSADNDNSGLYYSS